MGLCMWTAVPKIFTICLLTGNVPPPDLLPNGILSVSLNQCLHTSKFVFKGTYMISLSTPV